MPYTILLDQDLPVDPRKYGDIIAPALGVTRAEARMAVRRGRGIFLENLEEGHARRIAAELAKDSIKAHVLAREDLPVLPAIRKTTRLERGEIPWETVLVVHVGVVAKPEYREFFSHVPFAEIPPLHKLEGEDRAIVRENLILKMERRPPDGRIKPDAIFEEIDRTYGGRVKVYADLITADLGQWLRVPLDEIAYGVQAGGVKLGGPWGFQLLINDLREKCGAAFTEISLNLLEAVAIKESIFPRIEEFNRTAAWVAIKRVLWPNADSSSPSPEAPGSSTEGGSSSASSVPGPPSTSS